MRGTLEQWGAGRERAGGERERRIDREGREEKERRPNGVAQHRDVVPEEGAGLPTRRRIREEMDLLGTPREGGASGGQRSGRERVGGVERTRADLRGEENEGRRWMERGGDVVRRREESAEGAGESHGNGGWAREAGGSSGERERRKEVHGF